MKAKAQRARAGFEPQTDPKGYPLGQAARGRRINWRHGEPDRRRCHNTGPVTENHVVAGVPSLRPRRKEAVGVAGRLSAYHRKLQSCGNK